MGSKCKITGFVIYTSQSKCKAKEFILSDEDHKMIEILEKGDNNEN